MSSFKKLIYSLKISKGPSSLSSFLSFLIENVPSSKKSFKYLNELLSKKYNNVSDSAV